MEPLRSALKYFREDFEEHLRAGGCPRRVAGAGGSGEVR
jgi:hypothetical protein